MSAQSACAAKATIQAETFFEILIVRHGNTQSAAWGHAAYRNDAKIIRCRPGVPTGRVFQCPGRESQNFEWLRLISTNFDLLFFKAAPGKTSCHSDLLRPTPTYSEYFHEKNLNACPRPPTLVPPKAIQPISTYFYGGRGSGSALRTLALEEFPQIVRFYRAANL
jgi:hypothetical protein